jgi:hypothetical protein
MPECDGKAANRGSHGCFFTVKGKKAVSISSVSVQRWGVDDYEFTVWTTTSTEKNVSWSSPPTCPAFFNAALPPRSAGGVQPARMGAGRNRHLRGR